MSSFQMQTRVRRLFNYLEDFEKGIIRIPAFQRDFVWDNKKKLELFDSIQRGYPIGSVLFWRPEFEDLNHSSNFELNRIGSYMMKNKANDYFYILDGFQRLSTLFGCLINPSRAILQRDEEDWFNNFNIIYNLELKQFEINHKRNIEELEIFKVPLFKLVDGKEFFEFQKKLLKQDLEEKKINQYLITYEDLSAKFLDYSMPSIDLVGGSLSEAIDIFSRVNSTGAQITELQKLSAKTYSGDFRLGSLVNATLETTLKYNFYNKKTKENAIRELIFRCIQSSFGDLYLDNKKTEVNALFVKLDFETIVRNTLGNGIPKSIEFLIEEVGVVSYNLLPANLQFIFLVEFFNHVEFPSQSQIEKLKNWFWVTSYSNYFTIYNPTKRKAAFKHFQNFIKGEEKNPIYKEKPNEFFVVPELPKKLTLGSVRAKVHILFLLNSTRFFARRNYTEVSGFNSAKLFPNIDHDIIDKIGDNSNLLYMFLEKDSTTDLSKKVKNGERSKKGDYSVLFEMENHIDLSKYYIDSNSISEFRKRDFNKALEIRHRLISQAEKKFVENLGLKYIDLL